MVVHVLSYGSLLCLDDREQYNVYFTAGSELWDG